MNSMSLWAAARTLKDLPMNVPVSWLSMIDKDILRIPDTTDAINASVFYSLYIPVVGSIPSQFIIKVVNIDPLGWTWIGGFRFKLFCLKASTLFKCLEAR